MYHYNLKMHPELYDPISCCMSLFFVYPLGPFFSLSRSLHIQPPKKALRRAAVEASEASLLWGEVEYLGFRVWGLGVRVPDLGFTIKAESIGLRAKFLGQG